jgi:glyoxylase-like metal-dependent hydrolase (beta-lactamase superfamily II)
VQVTELKPGLWRWASDHPDWEPDEGLSRTVGSVYYERPAAVVLVDPLVPEGDDEARFWSALDRDVDRLGGPVAVVLTVPWHERSAALVVERYGASVAEDPPEGIEAIRITGVGGERETVLWLPGPRALVFGDILVGSPPRILDEWQPDDRRGEPIRAELRPLLDLPVELLLPSHGDPVLTDAPTVLADALR